MAYGATLRLLLITQRGTGELQELRPTRIRELKMKVKLFLFITGLALIGIPKTKAQDCFDAINLQEEVLIESSIFANQSLKYHKRGRSNDFAIGVHLAYNPNKFGAGFRFSYNFTDILRFAFDGDYYFHTNELRKFNVITLAGEKGEKYWGRLFDFNPNLNFVFGDGNFHFYLIGGLYFCYGYHEGANALNELTSYDIYSDGVSYTVDAEGNKWYDTYVEMKNGDIYYIDEKLVPGIGVGVNAGCGVEFQVTDELRLNFEQQLSLGLMTSWMAKLGVAYCF